MLHLSINITLLLNYNDFLWQDSMCHICLNNTQLSPVSPILVQAGATQRQLEFGLVKK